MYSYTPVLLFLALSIWWRIIDTKEVRRSVLEEFEMEMENLRVQIGEPKKDKEEDIERYRDDAKEKREKLRKIISNKR